MTAAMRIAAAARVRSVFRSGNDTGTETRTANAERREWRAPRLSWSGGGGYEIRTREGFIPTRFPSVRPRPLGESSAGKDTERPGVLHATSRPGRRRVWL